MKTNVYTKLTFAEVLEDAIQRSPYSKGEVAEHLGVSKSTVSNWVNGARKPDIDKVIQLCLFLDVDLYYMIGATLPCGELHPSEQELLMRFRLMDPEEKQALLKLSRVIVKQ